MADRGDSNPHDDDEKTLIALVEQSETGGSKRDIAEAVGKLADFYEDRGDLDQAAPLYDRAIELRERIGDAGGADLIVDLRNLATICLKRNQFDEAEHLYQRVLSICEEANDLDAQHTIAALTGMAALMRLQGRHDEAIPFYERALALSQSSEGEQGPQTAMRLKDLGTALLASGRTEESQPVLVRALRMAEGIIGRTHPVVAEILGLLVKLYEQTEQSELADDARTRLQSIAESEFESRTKIQERPEIINTSRHPLTGGIAPDWASGWGEDEHGVFVEITVGEVTQALRWCPPGRFLMGSPEDEAGRDDVEAPQTEITFAQGFWLFETPVTQALYQAVTGETPSRFEGLDRPVEQVSWDDAKAFLDGINERIPGLELCMPSEAQWEYACRAGSTTPFEPNVAQSHAGASITPNDANFNGNYPYEAAARGEFREETLPVKPRGLRPNAWGLWQMHGNIFELCEDAWQGSHEGAASDGSLRQVSRQGGVSPRVVRGGSWFGGARHCRAAFRRGRAPGGRDGHLGFRPARGQASGAQAGRQGNAERSSEAGKAELPAERAGGALLTAIRNWLSDGNDGRGEIQSAITGQIEQIYPDVEAHATSGSVELMPWAPELQSIDWPEDMRITISEVSAASYNSNKVVCKVPVTLLLHLSIEMNFSHWDSIDKEGISMGGRTEEVEREEDVVVTCTVQISDAGGEDEYVELIEAETNLTGLFVDLGEVDVFLPEDRED